MEKRPPIVAIMGHVDHGKTTLLDYIRKSRIAEREAGGITQSIGAYEIDHNGREITFVDTPGHEAFANMRSHGAKVADLAILVVAADDGVKPQTKNALHFINEEKIPYVVAINKIDKPNADIENTKQSLMNLGVYLEGMGGNISYHEISAKKGDGVSELLDLVILAADLEELPADLHAVPEGIILTSKLDSRKGIIAGVIVKNGTLRQGELIATKDAKGKVKMLSNFLGKQVKSLGPSSPALIIGFETMPEVGEVFHAGESAIEFCSGSEKKCESEERGEVSEKAIPLILKADELSSLQALKGVVCNLGENSNVVILSSDVGDIYENDIKIARTSKAIILGFKVKVDKAAQNIAKSEGVCIIASNVIYGFQEELIKHIKSALGENNRSMEILKIFGPTKGKEFVIGVRISKGTINNQESFEVWKNEKKVGDGRILNLQADKKDVGNVEENQEAGLLVESSFSLIPGITLIFPEL